MEVGNQVRKLSGMGKGTMGTVTEVLDSGKVKVSGFRAQKPENFEILEVVSLFDENPRSPSSNRTEDDPRSPRPGEHLILDRLPQFTICCWNALKLTFMKDPVKSDIRQEWLVRLTRAIKMDVLMLSEIPKTIGKQRISEFKCMLEEAAHDRFDVYYSELSGVGSPENQQEYHVAFIRVHPDVHVEATYTHKTGDENNRLDHAPFTVFLRTSRFQRRAHERIAITSVHLPPTNRRRDLLVQGKSFFRSFEQQLDWPDKLKKNRPMNYTSLDHNFCTFVIGGDFNCSPAKQLNLSNRTWRTMFDAKTATTSGRKAYDNFVLNASASRVWDSMDASLGGVPLTGGGRVGLSDHDAVVLRLRPLESLQI